MLVTPPVLPEAAALTGPNGRRYQPAATLTGDEGAILLFSVDWQWPSGHYDQVFMDEAERPQQTVEELVSIRNSKRLSEPPPFSRVINANLNNQFMLLGYDLPANRVEQGESFEVTLYWQSLRTTNTSYKVFNHLLDSTGTQYGGLDRTPQVFYSTILWNPGEVVVDRYPVPVFLNAPDGIYWLDVGLYPSGQITAPALPLVKDGAVLPSSSILLGPVKVGGQPAISIPPAAPEQSRDDQFGGLIALDGYSMRLDPESQTLLLNLYWSPINPVPLDYTLFIHLTDPAETVVAQADGPPVSGLYPTSFWDAGEQIFDRRQIPLTDLPAGTYQIRLGWYDPTSGQRLLWPDNPEGFIVLDAFQVQAGE
jgi:hypothetical protein